jgi:hypothetical protein
MNLTYVILQEMRFMNIELEAHQKNFVKHKKQKNFLNYLKKFGIISLMTNQIITKFVSCLQKSLLNRTLNKISSHAKRTSTG